MYIRLTWSGNERVLRGEEDRSMLHMYIWRQDNEAHQTLFEKGGKRERELNYIRVGKLARGTLYTCMGLPQWNPFILLMYDNWKINLKNSKRNQNATTYREHLRYASVAQNQERVILC
jgi:hypothetical protein